jgi:hypothetical protein
MGTNKLSIDQGNVLYQSLGGKMANTNIAKKPLHLAWLRDFPDVKVNILPKGLKAHTAIIAQSGSGKSFTLGRLIEEIALFTKARVFILDPNADFVRLHETNQQSWEKDSIKQWLGAQLKQDFIKKWKKVYINVITNRSEKDFKLRENHKVVPIRIDWLNLSIEKQCKILGININDFPGMFTILFQVKNRAIKIMKEKGNKIGGTEAYSEALYEEIASTAHEENIPKIFQDSFMRALVITFDKFTHEIKDIIWKGSSKESLRYTIEEGFNQQGSITVVDLPSLSKKKDEVMAASITLSMLWDLSRHSWAEALKNEKKNEERTPTFIVIDEAHNLSPADPYNFKNDLERDVDEIISKIATEGRKYGLFLIVVTQRPTRINPTIIAQCDNLCLQRVQNRNDLQIIERVFGILPEGWANQATSFGAGDAILCGEFVERPVNCHIAARRCAEGGANLKDNWY